MRTSCLSIVLFFVYKITKLRLSTVNRGQTIFPCIEPGDSAESTSKLCRALVADARNGSSFHTVSRGDLWNRSVLDRACSDATSEQGLLRVEPVTGRALLFRSAGPDGHVNPTTWHAGCATEGGKEKHILTFFRSVASSVSPQLPTASDELLQQPDDSVVQQESIRENNDVEDECEEGWIGPDCRQCAPGYTGDFCTRALESASTDSNDNSCSATLQPTWVVTRPEEPQSSGVAVGRGAGGLQELRVFDSFLSPSEVAHLSTLGKQLVQTKHGTVKGYMSRVELSKVTAAKKDAIYRMVRCTATR